MTLGKFEAKRPIVTGQPQTPAAGDNEVSKIAFLSRRLSGRCYRSAAGDTGDTGAESSC